jgi:hypothetical protein
MLIERELTRDEVELVWSIDRSEVIDNIYYYENGALVLKPEHYDMKGWPRGEAEKYTPILLDCFDRGGWFYGIFDDEVTLTPGLSRAREGHAVPNALTPVPFPELGDGSKTLSSEVWSAPVGPNPCGSDYIVGTAGVPTYKLCAERERGETISSVGAGSRIPPESYSHSAHGSGPPAKM